MGVAKQTSTMSCVIWAKKESLPQLEVVALVLLQGFQVLQVATDKDNPNVALELLRPSEHKLMTHESPSAAVMPAPNQVTMGHTQTYKLLLFVNSDAICQSHWPIQLTETQQQGLLM
jgi:hypothetical protein